LPHPYFKILQGFKLIYKYRSIVRDYNGTITVISDPGKETNFRILFPAHVKNAME